MFKIHFSEPNGLNSVSQEPPEGSPVIVVVDVTSLKALDVIASDLFSAGAIQNDYYFVTIEDFDKIGFHLTKVGFTGDLHVVFCTGSETGEIVSYTATMEATTLIDVNEKVTVLGLPAVEIAANQKVALTEGSRVNVSNIDNMPAVAIQPGQSVNVGSLPAVNIASGQKVGLDAGTKVGVSAIDAMPQVQIAPNQGVNVNQLPAVTIAANQEIGLKAGSTVGIDGSIQATIANGQAIGVYPVRRN